MEKVVNPQEKQKARKRAATGGSRERLAAVTVAFVAMALVAAFTMVGGGSAASAATGPNPDDWTGAAFLIAHDATPAGSVGCYLPLPENSDNSWVKQNTDLLVPAAVNVVCRNGTGQYEVLLQGFDSAGVTHVNAIEPASPQGHTCKLAAPDHSTDADRTLFVNCYDSSGNPADAQFGLSFTNRKPTTGTFGYFTTEGNGPWGCPPLQTVGQYHASGGLASVCSFFPGVYTVTLPPQAATIGNVQVTAVGTDSARCKAEGWWASSITVRCYDGATLTASDFGLTYVGSAGGLLGGNDCCFLGSESPAYAFVWDALSPVLQMEAPAWYQYNENPTVRAEVTNGPTIGEHTTRFFSAPGVGVPDIAMVTAVGPGPEYCNLKARYDYQVVVNCFDSSGNPASTPHNVALNSGWRP